MELRSKACSFALSRPDVDLLVQLRAGIVDESQPAVVLVHAGRVAELVANLGESPGRAVVIPVITG